MTNREHNIAPYVATYGALTITLCDSIATQPTSGMTIGDLSFLRDTGVWYVCTALNTWTVLGGGSHPNLAVHDALGLATDAELAAHAADPIHGGAHPNLATHDALGLATDSELSAAIAAHIAALDPHTGYELEANKDAAFGYPSLNASAKVPIIELPYGSSTTASAPGDTVDQGTTAAGLSLSDHRHSREASLTAIDFLVGTATGLLSGEIVVGATPNGELGGTWGAITVDTTHSGSAHHSAITLGSDADVLLGLTGQQIDLDTQTANKVFAGPTSGGAADPTFRSLVVADLPATTLLSPGASGLKETRAITVETPTAAEDMPIWVTPYAITITNVYCFLRGGTSVAIQIAHGTNPASTVNLWSSSQTANTLTSVQTMSTSYNDATIAAGEAIKLVTTALSGVVNVLSVTIEFTRD